MSLNLSVLFLVLAFFAEIIGTIGGFGSSVFFCAIIQFLFRFPNCFGDDSIISFIE